MKKLLKRNHIFPKLAGLLVFLVPVGAFAQGAAPVSMAGFRSISVEGEAKGEFNPDQAVIRFSVTSRDKALAVAKKANDDKLAQLVGVTQEYNIPTDKVVPSGVYISPEYNYNNKQNKPELTGYSVSRSLSITTKDLARQEELLSALVGINIDQVNNVEFQLAEPEKNASELRVRAFENAKARAEALAKAAGAKLGPALHISTTGAHMPQPPMPMMAMARAEMAADASVAPSLPGAITLMERVNVTFGLE